MLEARAAKETCQKSLPIELERADVLPKVVNTGSSISGQGAAPIVVYVRSWGTGFNLLVNADVDPELPQLYPTITGTD